jgi:hypothetical protein
MNKKLKKALIIVAIVFSVLLFILIAVKVGEKLIYSSFYSNATRQFKMPGAWDGLVQQGFEYNEDAEVFLAGGYMSNGSASRIYVISRSGEEVSYTCLKNQDGSDYTGHVGGIESYNGYLLVADGGRDSSYGGGIDIFSLHDILQGKEEARKIGRIKTYNNPAYCHIYDGYLFAGEFYREKDYETALSHRIETPAGDKNTALTMVFKLDTAFTDSFGINPEPIAGISTTDAIQGMVAYGDRENGKIVLSSSYGLSTSKIRVYDMKKISDNGVTKDIDGKVLPIYYLDKASLERTIDAPPMAEEMVYLNGELYILNESASNKYIFGKFMSGNYVYSYNMNK